MKIFRTLYPDMHHERMEALEERLNKVDNSLFSLMISSDFGPHSPNSEALKSFFNYIQAGRELCDEIGSAPIKQRAALKILLHALHTNLEREIESYDANQF
ncbi:hypothetical protein PEBR_35841 [Penicillium brasilianum]|uniref:Uncharacterized protein n=1 Tax=Penicillium brasilianum TaxID=104259 RepID=A0A1S9RDP5_PENBI|nr:hypothetical protein PEBR_35841 [Penicillium brasilianum]